MKKNKKKKITVKELLSIISDESLISLAKDTHVDYCSKVLYGRSVFYMLLLGLLESDRASLRSMEDIFNSRRFKFLFNIKQEVSVKHNSISERLSVIDVGFFERLFELFYTQLSTLYSKEDILQNKIIRVDSTMVAETSARLSKGMNVGRKKDGKKQIKYTIGFDGLFPCSVEVFTDQKYLSEDHTIPKVVFDYAKKKDGKIFVFDRGVQKRTTFEKMSEQKVEFVGRLNESARKETVRIIEQGNGRRIGGLFLVSDEEIRLFRNSGKITTDETFRLITAQNETGETYLFLTNIFDLEPDVITLFYRKRWDIEVFFRFIKQELNFSHFMSTNENGIKIILYMTLILSMLILIYKRINQIGYKTAKRRFVIELDELIMAIVVQHCGGDPSRVFT
ncbi:MAG: IS4 family transposase [Paludibacter sp.]|nr:IS4 family transposase [Paludibacter sp.]